MMKQGMYQHYKGKFYEVIGTATHSESLEDFVVYRALTYNDPKYGDNHLWIRPKSMFLEEILVDGKAVPRFKYVK